jgi:hypothetical protein
VKLFFSYNEDFKEITDIFLSSIKDSFDLIPIEIENFHNKWQVGGGKEGGKMKKDLIDYAFDQTEKEEVFMICDVDIKFYKSVLNVVEEEINKEQKVIENNTVKFKKIDILFQKENLVGSNIGFIAMRNNQKVKSFWNNVYNVVFDCDKWDQLVVNEFLYDNTLWGLAEVGEIFCYKSNNFPIWNRFSDVIWNWSMGSSGIKPNQDICLHHANCAITKESKLNQFSYVEDCLKNSVELDYSKNWFN